MTFLCLRFNLYNEDNKGTYLTDYCKNYRTSLYIKYVAPYSVFAIIVFYMPGTVGDGEMLCYAFNGFIKEMTYMILIVIYIKFENVHHVCKC